jgi:vacuolar-type H+-ATPase subunit I/STV1
MKENQVNETVNQLREQSQMFCGMIQAIEQANRALPADSFLLKSNRERVAALEAERKAVREKITDLTKPTAGVDVQAKRAAERASFIVVDMDAVREQVKRLAPVKSADSFRQTAMGMIVEDQEMAAEAIARASALQGLVDAS